MDPWNKLNRNFSCLAPMEGVTDIVFRQVIAKAARPDLYFTEFTNVNSFASPAGQHNALERFRFLPQEQPIIAQIWGKTPEYFTETAQGLKALGYKAVDINMGCPDKHVVANGGGSALIRTPDLARRIISATKEAGLPVSIKTRLGYSRIDEWPEWLATLLAQNLAALTIHLRTKKEMSKVAAHHELVPDIVKLRDTIAPHTKLIINGDIKNIQDGQRFIQAGADGIMIGRGVFADPFCFQRSGQNQISFQPGNSASAIPYPNFPADRFELLQYHLNLFDKYQPTSFDPLKRFFKIYINSFPGASETREQLMLCKNTAEVRDILAKTTQAHPRGKEH